MNRPIKKRDRAPYDLPRSANGNEAWFYVNRASINLVVRERGHAVEYRFKLRDMKRIVEALS